ncbi:unnamed protein product [Durusdinium trenchii]
MQNCEVKPNVISCNSVISSCEKAGEWQQALHFLEYMDTVAVEPSIISYNAAISACEKANHWRQALELFTLASTQTRLAGDVVGVNAALSACAKAAAQTQALSLFRAMPQMKLLPDVISYSTVITGQPWPQVLNLLELMGSAAVQPNTITRNAAITSCVTGVWPSWPVALELLRAAEHRSQPNRSPLGQRSSISHLAEESVATNVVLSGCVRAAAWQAALELFAKMVEVASADAVSYSVAISAAEEATAWQDALLLLLATPRDAAAPLAFAAAISTVARAGHARWPWALELLRQMAREEVLPDVVCFNAAISSCEKAGQWPQALSLLDELGRRRTASVVSYSAAISALRSAPSGVERARVLFDAMQGARVQPNVVSFVSLLSCYETAWRWPDALHLLISTSSTRALISSAAGNVAMSACEKALEWEQALRTFWWMIEQSLQPDLISYVAAMSSCEKGHQWQAALSFFERMRLESIRPDVTCFNAAISCCEKALQWQQSLELLAAMASFRVASDSISLSAAMSACTRSSRWSAALYLFTATLPCAPCARSAQCAACAVRAAESCVRAAPEMLEMLQVTSVMAQQSAFQ